MENNPPYNLEPQQYQRLYWEEDVPVRDYRSGLIRRMFYVSLGLFFVLIAVAALVRFPDQIELPFVLKAEQQEAVYKFPFPVYLTKSYIKPGDPVLLGQKLAHISSPEIAQMIHAFNESQEQEQRFDKYGKLSAQKRKEILTAALRQNDIRIAELKQQYVYIHNNWKTQSQKLSFEWELAKEQERINRQLWEDKSVSRLDFQQKENEAFRAGDEWNKAQNQFRLDSAAILSAIEKIRLESAGAVDEIAVIEANAANDATGYKRRHELVYQKMVNTFGPFEITNGELVLVAPYQGNISFVFEGEKEIKSGATLLKISPGAQPNYAFIKCPPASAGKLNRGQQCHLKVASFPFYEWGIVRGRIAEQSLTPDESGNYNIKIRLTDLGKLDSRLFPGLSGAAVIIIEEKTLLQYFFRSVKKKYAQLMEGG